MLVKLKSFLIGVRSSLWFVPTIMVGGAIASALALVEADKHYAFKWATFYPLLFGAGAEGSRGMLTTIASSMITIAGLTFSLTIAALVTASAQYTSRILRNFMRDRRNQVVLGSFVGIFTYCLVVLRTIRSGDEGAFVPSLAVFVGLLLALLGIGVLVFFIHHIATSIQASTIIASITSETLAAIDKRFPEETKDCVLAYDDDATTTSAGSGHRQVVRSNTRGYVQDVDVNAMTKLGAEYGVTVRVDVPPGTYVAQHARLLTFVCGEVPGDGQLALFRDRIAIHAFRTIDLEFGFGIRQLVDIALKALSPGINDTTTAVMCIDHLRAVVEHLAVRPMPVRHCSDDGVVRLLLYGWSFDDVIATAFDQIRNNAIGNVAVIQHLLDAISGAADATDDEAHRRALKIHFKLVGELAAQSVDAQYDRDKLVARFNEGLEVFGRPRNSSS